MILNIDTITPKIKCNTGEIFKIFREKFYKQISKEESNRLLNMKSLDILKEFDIKKANDLYEPALSLYSDLEDYELLCYPLEELLVEKLRCTMQRTQPRDYYDIWYLVEVEEMNVEYFTNEFRNKCLSKELKPEDFHNKLEQKLPQYKARWQKSMSDQIKDLPDFEQVEREVSRKIKNWMK